MANNTYRQIISDISSEIRMISADSYIPPRMAYYEIQNIVGDFLKKSQEAKRKLQSMSEGWLEIEGIKMEEVPVISCPDIDVRLCDRMMKSIKKIPTTYTYTFGDIIKHVASPNFAYFFEPTTPRQWKNLQNQQYKNKNKYYYFFVDGHIYLPIPKRIDLAIEELRMSAYFIDPHQVDQFKADTSCYDCKKIDLCKSPLDYEIVCPFFLINDVKTTLLNRLVKIFVPLKEDPYPNLNDLSLSGQQDKQNAQ